MPRLRDYERKRDFRRTPEPRGADADTRRRFVIHKHDARRLHYDLRLEMDGVLKSWAVPKGPSFDPQEKRLAVHVEDHPLEYADFEGVIPAGEYGAGPVMVWDYGTWDPVGDPRTGYRKGRLHFRVNGARLRGEWVLARMHGAAAAEGKENWLLLKIDDVYARPDDGQSDESAVSVRSGRTLPEIAQHPEFTWSNDGQRASESRPAPAAMPAQIDPQLATLVERPPAGVGWLHEIKLDGYRVLARIEHGTVTLFSRNGKDWSRRFGAIATALSALPLRSAWLDGEVAALLPDGRTSFSALQQALSEERDDRLVYFLFDLLYRNDEDLRNQPLLRRKAILAGLLAPYGEDTPLRISEYIEGNGERVYDEACRLGLEGLVSKRADRAYVPGRSREWLKVKCRLRQEFVIGGFSAPGGARTAFGALLLGVYEGERLIYVGRTGTGFTEQTLRDLRARLAPLEMPVSPFATPVPKARSGKNIVTWVQPVLVAEVEFAEWTADGILRQAAFLGLREDKAPRQVRRETFGPSAPVAQASARSSGVARSPPRTTNLRLTHPDKVLYPVIGLTKTDLARYYERVAELMLPDLIGRPLTLLRCPEGRHMPCFYQKHANHTLPAGIRRIPIAEKDGTGQYLAVESIEGVVGLVQMGVLEIHTWGAHADRPDQPDRMVLDVDPDDGLPWGVVTDAVQHLRLVIESVGLACYLKTTGGKGLHVVIPLARRHSWSEVKIFAHGIARAVARMIPSAYTTNPTKAARKGKVYIDYLRNTRGATAIANYSTRAKPHAPVSVPIDWDELGTPSDAFCVKNIDKRLTGTHRNVWAGYFDQRQVLTIDMRARLGIEPSRRM